MKKYKLYILVMFLIAAGFAACQDDDKTIVNDIEKAKSFAGFYRGKMNVHIDNAAADEIWQQAQLGVVEDNIYLNIECLWIKEIKFGNFRVPNLTAYESTEGLTFLGQTNLSLDNISNVNVAVEGTIKDGKMKLNFSIKSVSIPSIYSSMEAVKRDTVVGEKIAQVLSLSFEDERILMQPQISEKNKTIDFFITDTITSPNVKLKPVLALNNGAYVDTNGKDSLDFSGGSTKLTVYAQDAIHRDVYTVRMYKVQSQKHNLDSWKLMPTGETNPDLQYLTPSDAIWQTDNASLRYLKGLGLYATTAPYLVEETTDAVKNSAAKITNKYVAGATPALQVGLLYTGEQLSASTSNPLLKAKYGTASNTKPIKIEGSYKYVAGTNYYDNGVINASVKDSCMISAVLYEISESADYLDGANLFSNENVVAVGSFIGSPTSTSSYVNFELYLSYSKSYYFSKKYKLAILYTPSFKGFLNKGADNSTLWVDEVQVFSQADYR